MDPALRERREGPDRLDLVAEELDPERLAPGGREDVDATATDRDVAALLRPLDPLVTRKCKLLDEVVDAAPVARCELDRLGPRIRGRHPLGDRGGGGAHEPAGREHVERARPLADEVRRRLEAGLPADAAARQQRDPRLAEAPRRR